MAAKNMGKRPRLQKVNNPQCAFVISRTILNYQSARQQKISRKKNAGSAIIKRDVGFVVSGRRNYVDNSVSQIHIGNSVRPVGETEERLNSFQIYGYDLNRWKRRELRIASTMIQMPVSMCHKER